jgi:hypothetical protein
METFGAVDMETFGRLTREQAEHFLERGYVRIPGAFDPARGRAWLDEAWVRFGYDRDDPASWAEKRIHLSSRSHVDSRTFAPAAWSAAVDLVGGTGRVDLPWEWGDGFIANLGVGGDRPWQPPSASASGFVPAAPRERVVPQRVLSQQAREAAENERLAARHS